MTHAKHRIGGLSLIQQVYTLPNGMDIDPQYEPSRKAYRERLHLGTSSRKPREEGSTVDGISLNVVCRIIIKIRKEVQCLKVEIH